MTKLEEFKNFVKDKKYIIDKVHSNETSWQKLYEIYDLYGEEHEVFKETTNTINSTLLSKEGLSNAVNMIKNVDLDKLSSGLENVKKVVGAIQEITKPSSKTIETPEYLKKSTFKRYND